MKRRVWITRDKNNCNELEVFIWPEKEKPINYESHGPDVIFYTGKTNPIFSLDVSPFKRLFGFTPKKGSCKLYDLECNLFPS